MENILVTLLVVCPFLGFLINLLAGKKLGKTLPGIIATLAVSVSFVVSLIFFVQILSTGKPIVIQTFDWVTFHNFSVNLNILLDQLSLLWLLFVTGIGALIHIYSIGYMKGDENVDRFFSYLNLFIFFMILLVTASNLGMMFIGWEGVAMCSYLLIGFWYKNQSYNDAAKKAFIMNRIGDLGFLTGLFILAYLFNTVDFESLKTALTSTENLQSTFMLSLAALFLFAGAIGKSAQLPLYTWLPDAMAGPTPVSALIHAATMVTGGIFMISRLNFLFDLTPDVGMIISIVGAVTALFAATIGIAQTDIKKVLAYSTVSQLGLMFMAIGLGAYHVAIFHVVTHAFFKACLFLGAGSVIHAMGGEQDMRRMGGLRKVMGITFVTFLVSTLSISGLPPFAGFFSKDEILLTAFEHNKFLWVIGALASLLTAFYMFRALFLTFYKDFRGTEEQKHHLHESPKTMTFPLIILGILATVGGVIGLPFGFNWLNNYLTPVISNLQGIEHHDGLTQTGWILMGVSTLIALIGLGIAYTKYISKAEVPVEDNQMKGLTKVLYHKYYIDEIYDGVFIKPLYTMAGFFRDVVERVISAIVFFFGKCMSVLSGYGTILQSGNIGFYLFIFVLGFCSIIVCLFLI